MPALRERTVHIVHGDAQTRRALHARMLAYGLRARAFAAAEFFLSEGLPERPDCLLLDSDLPRGGSAPLQVVAQRRDVNIPVVFVADEADVPAAVRAMKAGAIDFLATPVSDTDLRNALACAFESADALRADELRREQARMRVARLTPREHAVFELLLEGRLNKQIADALDSQEATVKVHRSRLVRKLEVRSLAELLDLGRQLESPAPALHSPRQWNAARAGSRLHGDFARATAWGDERVVVDRTA